MLADLFMALRRGIDQLTYWCHTYLPFNRWRQATNEVIATAKEEAARLGLQGVAVDRRRAYQVARMTVTSRRGEHLSDLLPNAYRVYSPTSCATTHSGKKKFEPPAQRRDGFRRHPQTLAYLFTPPSLARMGLGGSLPGTLIGVGLDEPTPPAGVIANRIREEYGRGTGGSAVDQFAQIVARLHAGPPEAVAGPPEDEAGPDEAGSDKEAAEAA